MSNQSPPKRDADLIERSKRLIAESVAMRQQMREMQEAADRAMATREASTARTTG